MIQIEQPTHRIIINIKDGEIIGIDWGILFSKPSKKSYPQLVEKYLKKAIKFMYKSEGK